MDRLDPPATCAAGWDARGRVDGAATPIREGQAVSGPWGRRTARGSASATGRVERSAAAHDGAPPAPAGSRASDAGTGAAHAGSGLLRAGRGPVRNAIEPPPSPTRARSIASVGQPPIRNIFVPQTGQVPWAAGLPFFIVICCAFFISRFALHFTQYASATPGASLSSRWTSSGPCPALVRYERYGFVAAIL